IIDEQPRRSPGALLIEEVEAVAGADYRFVTQPVGESDAWRKLVVMHVQQRAGIAILPRDCNRARTGNEIRLAVVTLGRPGEEVPAHAVVDRQLARGAPLVLPEQAVFRVAQVRHAAGSRSLGRRVWQAQQKIRPRVAGARRAGRIVRVIAREAESARRGAELKEAERIVDHAASELHGVLAARIGERVAQL